MFVSAKITKSGSNTQDKGREESLHQDAQIFSYLHWKQRIIRYRGFLHLLLTNYFLLRG